MEASEIFNIYIGSKIRPIIFKYGPYYDEFETHPFLHKSYKKFEKEFSEIMFKSIVFYAYEKNEIEKEYHRGKMTNLENSARTAYENRVPKTERKDDGLLGELVLDCFIKCFFNDIQMLFSRVKYLERYPKTTIDDKRSGHEVKGYDSMLFSIEKGKKYMWLGQAKTGGWDYCFDNIKKDIEKSLLKNYFSSSMVIMADIMRAASYNSDELEKIIDDLNDICLEYQNDTTKKYQKIHDYFCKEDITIRIPCLLILDEKDYNNENEILTKVKEKCKKKFNNFVYDNDGLNVEILLLIFPVKNLDLLRNEFLNKRKIK